LTTQVSPVKKLAGARGISIIQPPSLNDESVRGQLEVLHPDAIVTAAFGLIFPQALLDIPRYGAINIHASLLPRWRGAAPVQRAILAGDHLTGVSIMRMNAGLDTGPVFLRAETPISDLDTTGTLTERIAALGAGLVVQVLDAIGADAIRAVAQPDEGVTYASKLDKRESRLDWRETAAAVDRRVRAFSPSPGASARLRGVELKIWSAEVSVGKGDPGEVLSVESPGVRVACGSGALTLTELQRSGGRRLPAAEFLRGFPLTTEDRFEP
jgi:methionyl-tRNA formyltransferase